MRPTTTVVENKSIRLSAVGDLLLAAGPAGTHPPRETAAIFADVRPLFRKIDLVVGNLECTLPGSGATVPTEPRVIATEDHVRAVAAAGITTVSLANNHMFDCLAEGFHRLRRLLDELGITYFGAGDNLREAAAPAIVQVRGVRVGFLGAADPRTGPSGFAEPGVPGVAPLKMTNLIDDIRRLRAEVDHVIVSLHWGEERLSIPSPTQVEQAHALADAGASLILGHHPHVLQGLEVYRGVPIIYSLGNFVAFDVPFSDGDRLAWNRTERTGCVLQVDLGPDSTQCVGQIATYDDGVRVGLDTSGFGDRRIAKVNGVLARGVTSARYRREFFWVKTVLPILAHLKWSELKGLRPGRLLRFLRSAGCAARAE
ncbi:MAG: CapA family protein [Acidobacteria bacterium]|nr:CapA family protein [Planctomycetota bacterium]MBE3135388.1 CapA family protein [Acidobacteriota bacterium]